MRKTLMMGLMDEIHHRSLCLCPPPSPAAATKRGKRDRELTGAGGRTLQRRKGVGTKPRGRDQERGGPYIARLRERRGRGEE